MFNLKKIMYFYIFKLMSELFPSFFSPIVTFSAEAPTIIEPPEARKVVAEGTSINMTCRVTGKPDPIITWFKDEQQITGGRYKIQPKGDLFIKVEPARVVLMLSFLC